MGGVIIGKASQEAERVAEGIEVKVEKDSRRPTSGGGQLRLRGIVSTVLVVALICGLVAHSLFGFSSTVADPTFLGPLAILALVCVVVAWYTLGNRPR